MAYYQFADNSVMDLDHTPKEPCTRLTRAEGARLKREHAIEELRALLKPGDTVHCILRHVSRSGLRRSISLVIVADNDMRDITYAAALAMNDKLTDDGGIKVDGFGMDMGFHLVYKLGRTLWPQGTPYPHSTRNGEPDTAGGYALKHHWL